MARGWESKSVEDQIAEKEAMQQKPVKDRQTANQVAAASERESLLLARAHTLREIGATRNSGYLKFLETRLHDLEAQLARSKA